MGKAWPTKVKHIFGLVAQSRVFGRAFGCDFTIACSKKRVFLKTLVFVKTRVSTSSHNFVLGYRELLVFVFVGRVFENAVFFVIRVFPCFVFLVFRASVILMVCRQ